MTTFQSFGLGAILGVIAYWTMTSDRAGKYRTKTRAYLR